MAWMIAYRCHVPLLPIHCMDWSRRQAVPFLGTFRNFIARREEGCGNSKKSKATIALFLGSTIPEKRMWCKGCPLQTSLTSQVPHGKIQRIQTDLFFWLVPQSNQWEHEVLFDVTAVTWAGGHERFVWNLWFEITINILTTFAACFTLKIALKPLEKNFVFLSHILTRACEESRAHMRRMGREEINKCSNIWQRQPLVNKGYTKQVGLICETARESCAQAYKLGSLGAQSAHWVRQGPKELTTQGIVHSVHWFWIINSPEKYFGKFYSKCFWFVFCNTFSNVVFLISLTLLRWLWLLLECL